MIGKIYILEYLDDKIISRNARFFLQRLEQAKEDKKKRQLTAQLTETIEDGIIEELTDMFQKKYNDTLESNFAVITATGDDEQSYKTWKSRMYSIS